MQEAGSKRARTSADDELEAGEVVETPQEKLGAFRKRITPRCDSVTYVERMRATALLGMFQTSYSQVLAPRELHSSFLPPAGTTALRHTKTNKIEELLLDGAMLNPRVRDKLLAYQTCANRGLTGAIECLNGEYLLVRETLQEGSVLVNSANYWDYTNADPALVTIAQRVWEIIAQQDTSYTANCLKSIGSALLSFARRTKRSSLVEVQDNKLGDHLEGDPAAVLISLFPVVFDQHGAAARHVAEGLIACLCSNTNVNTLVEQLVDYCTPKGTFAGVLLASNLFHAPEVPVHNTVFRQRGLLNETATMPLHDVPEGFMILCQEALPSGSQIVGIGRTTMVYAFPGGDDVAVEKSSTQTRTRRNWHTLNAPHLMDARVLLKMAEHVCPAAATAVVASASGAVATNVTMSTYNPDEDSE